MTRALGTLQHDVLIIGGGIGGLTAAFYLGRFRRPAVLIDAGASRARWIPESHNIPGFPDGIGGDVLLARLRAQAERYGLEAMSGQVDSLAVHGEGFRVTGADFELTTRFLVVATGVEDHLPPLVGAEEALLRSVLRICPICDAYEATGKRIAVLGQGAHGEREAAFLRTYSDQVAYLEVGRQSDPARREQMARQGIELLEVSLDALSIEAGVLHLVQPAAARRSFDVVYAALGCRPRVSLLTSLGAECDENDAVRVDAHQMTTVPGLYAVGDMVRGLNQVVVAAAEAAVAVTDIHNRLRNLDRMTSSGGR